MRAKERVLLAIDHQEPDRVPLDYGASEDVTQRLCDHLAIVPPAGAGGQGRYEALLERLHVDLRHVEAKYLGPELNPGPNGVMLDKWGVGYSKEWYTVYHPLMNATTVADIEAYPFPDPDAYDYERLAEQCERVAEYAVCGGEWSPFFTWGMELMGAESFFLSMRERPEVVHALLGRMVDYYCETARRMFEAAKGGFDVFYMGDDYGMQQGPFISRRDFSTFVLPHLKRLFGLAKSYSLKVMLHSCGSVRAFLPDLIEAGLDVLDPVQVRAVGMDVNQLKRDFGKRLAFHGSIDTQRTLPHGTPEEVRSEILDRMAQVAPGGGLILCGTQDYLADIPVENIVTIYDTVIEYGRYPIRKPIRRGAGAC